MLDLRFPCLWLVMPITASTSATPCVSVPGIPSPAKVPPTCKPCLCGPSLPGARKGCLEVGVEWHKYCSTARKLVLFQEETHDCMPMPIVVQ